MWKIDAIWSNWGNGQTIRKSVCVLGGFFFFFGVGWGGGGEEIKKKKTNGHQNVESWQSNWNFSKNNQLYFQQDNDNY